MNSYSSNTVKQKAHEIRRTDYSGKCENLYEIRFEAYSGYTKHWSTVWRDIYAESEDDAIAWANEYAEAYNREAKEKGWKGNMMRYESLRQITELPRPEEYPTMAEVEHELALEGYPIDD